MAIGIISRSRFSEAARLGTMYVPTIQMLVPGACVVDLHAIFGFILVSGLWIE